MGTILLLGAGAAISLLWNRQAPNHDTDTMVQKPASVVPAPVHTPPPAPGMREASSPKARQTPPVISSASETPGLPAQPAQLAATPLPRDSADKPRQTDYSLALKRGHLAERLRELSTPELPGGVEEQSAQQPAQGVTTPPAQQANSSVLPATVTRDLVAEIVQEVRSKATDQNRVEAVAPLETQTREQPTTNPDKSISTPNDLDIHYRALPIAQHNGVPITAVTVHVYYDDPARRFILGGRKRYVEGDSMPNGVKLESITRRGIILEYQGKQYRYDIGLGG